MANLEKVIRITEDDYSTLLGGGTITKDGVTYTYDESALYVIQNEDPPAYAETAGVANTAVADTNGDNIAATYDKKPLVIEVDDTDTSVPQGTYASITAALAEGREVLMKVTMTVNDGEIEYMRIRRDYSYANGSYTFYNNYYTVEVLENNSIDILFESADNHFHGNITREGKLQTTDITIANGDKLVVTDASNSNKVARASLAFDGSTTTQALTKKGTWETFAKPTMVVTVTRSGTYPNFIYTANKTYAEIGAALEAGTNVVLVQNNYYYWFYAKGSGSTPDLVFKSVSNADMQPVSDGSINYIQSYRITINSSNTLTLSSDIINLTGKVDKVTSTDNAIARFDGTGGQIQNSGVTINDSNHVTAAKFITSGGTNSQFVKGNGSLDSTTYTPQTAAGANSLLSSLPDWTATPTDTTKLVRRDTGGSASFGQVTFLTVWNYINSKAATVYAPLASPALTDTPTAPTAIAGTNTTQIATTAFVQNAVTSAIAGVTQFNYQVVTTLPATGQKGTIYLISNGGSGQNIYDEYIWYEDTEISGRWEKIGTTEVDLSGYAKLSPTSTQTFTGDHMLKGTLTVNNPSSGGSLPQPSEIAIGSNGKITLAGEGDFSKIISGSVTLQDALDEKQEKLLVITINGGDITNNSFSVASGTYARIGEALAAGKEVFIKIDFQEDYEGIDYYYFCRDDHSNSEYTFECIAANTSAYLTLYGNDTGDISSWNFASLESPALTGTPTAPTAATGTNTTQVATTAFVQAALSNMGAGGSEMVDVTITGTTSSASFSTNPYNAIKAVVDDGKIAVLNASVAPLSATGVLIPVYEYTYSQSGSDFTGYKGSIQHGSYEISVDVQSTSSATVTITEVSATITVDTALSETSTNPVQNRVITAQILENEEIVATALNNLNDRVELKQDQLVSGTTIKTINNQSILGSGNISISGGGGGGGGEENVIESITFNGTAVPVDANKNAAITADVPMVVTITGSGGTYTADKTFAEITSAISNGTLVVLVDSTSTYTLYSVNSSLVRFLHVNVDTGNEYIYTTGYSINSSNVITNTISGVEIVSNVSYDSSSHAITEHYQGSTTNVVTAATLVTDGGGYIKPSGGIPATDLASAVQTSLGLADTALQSYTETDPVFTASAASGITSSNIATWNGKYTKPSGGIPDTDLTTAVNVRLLPTISGSSDIGKIARVNSSYSGYELVKPITVYSGSSAPSSSTGSNGDIYIQTS